MPDDLDLWEREIADGRLGILQALPLELVYWIYVLIAIVSLGLGWLVGWLL